MRFQIRLLFVVIAVCCFFGCRTGFSAFSGPDSVPPETLCSEDPYCTASKSLRVAQVKYQRGKDPRPHILLAKSQLKNIRDVVAHSELAAQVVLLECVLGDEEWKVTLFEAERFVADSVRGSRQLAAQARLDRASLEAQETCGARAP